jgi:hypothetical protein
MAGSDATSWSSVANRAPSRLGAVAVPDTLSRVRWFGRLVGWYLLIALGTRIAETAGLRMFGCAPECSSNRPLVGTFRWVLPYGHRPRHPGEQTSLAEA